MIAIVWSLPEPWWVACGLPLVAGWGLWQWRADERRRRRELGGQCDAVAGRPRWGRVRAIAEIGMLAALAVALLGPVVPGDVGDGGADVVVCVDVSWSMAARDEQPSRLAAAQRAVGELVGIDARSRVGLVAFAGDAVRQAPLTGDVAAVAQLAADLFAGGASAGTDPGAAIDLATTMLQRSGRPGGTIVLASDGEDSVGGGAGAAARARQAGLVVQVLGLGSEAGSKIPIDDGKAGESFLRTTSGGDVVTRRESAALRQVAAAGGGRVLGAEPNVLRSLHDGEALPSALAAAVQTGRVAPVPLGHWPLLLAVAFWMLRQCLPERSR